MIKLQIDIEFIKEQAEYFKNHVCNKELSDWQIENELIMMFKEAGVEVQKSGQIRR